MRKSDSKERIVELPSPWWAARRAFANHLRDRKFLASIGSSKLSTALGKDQFANFTGDYLISGNRGVYAVVEGRCVRLSNAHTYGIAVRNGTLWCASSGDRYSSISRAKLPSKLEPGKELKFEEIHRSRTSKKGRIHQITFVGERLAVAATEENAILFLDPTSGEEISASLPFRDHFGDPVRSDHNHINSVSQCGECVLFCAYKAGENALLCVLKEDLVRAYPITNQGAHDVYIEGQNLWYSDTFGLPIDQGGKECGYLMKNNRPVEEAYFSKPPGKVVRGIAGTGTELLVGHSHKGPRSKRYKGKGSIIRLVDEKVVEEVELPFAQVYDILRLDGKHFDNPPKLLTWDEVNAHFASILGPCVYEQKLD